MSFFSDGLRGLLSNRFLERLVASPRGHAFLLQFMLDAEEADELGVFDRLVARVDDPELSSMVRKHRDDETRHAQLLRARLAALGAPIRPAPEELRVVPYLNRALGGVGEQFSDGRAGVMEAYLLLQVLEERAVVQFPRNARALATVDPESARVLGQILEDERRHVKYARAISRRYAPDARTLETTLARYRRAEARAFVEHGRVLMRHVLAEGLLDVRPPERLLWRALAA